MARSFQFTTHVPGFEIWIEYNAANLRIQTVSWEVPTGVVAHAYVWENDVLVIDTALSGVGSHNIPGVHQLIEDVDEFGNPILRLPPELRYRFEFD